MQITFSPGMKSSRYANMYRRKIAGGIKSFFYNRLEGLFLGFRGKRCLAAEKMVEKIRLIHLGIFCKVQQIVNIGIAVCESREEESVLRCTDHPVLHAVFNRVVGNIVEESRFVKLYRTDAAEDKFINVIRGIIHIQVIRSTSRNIV